MKKELRAILAALLGAAVIFAFVAWRSAQEPPISDRPPDLTIAYGEEEVAAWRGSYQWERPQGELMQGVIADAPHPLDALDDLPVIPAVAGDQLVLVFGGVPDKAEAVYYRASDQALTAQAAQAPLSNENRLILPEDCAGTVWVIRAKWEGGTVKGQAEYAFFIP